MVVGGDTSWSWNDVEMVDLTGQDRQCRKPEDFPGAYYGSVGAYVQGQAIVCGGYTDPSSYSSDCYSYNPGNGAWTEISSMISKREYAASTFIQGHWWVTGGYMPLVLSDTEVLISNCSFIPYYDLPVARYHHSIVALDSNKAMLLGGQGHYFDTYMYDINIGNWTDGPLLSTDR